jgi:hypothetical protein
MRECIYARQIWLRVPHASDCEDGNGLYDDYLKIDHETREKRDADYWPLAWS